MATDGTERPLFIPAEGAITRSMLAETLRGLGLAAGDTVMAHTELLRFGRIPAERMRDRGGLFNDMLGAIRDVIGPEGTLILPTLTTESLATGRFDAARTPSETGVLTEHFRRSPDVHRTPHPTHSMAVQGPQAPLFMRPPAHPFGTGSAFDVLRGLKGKLLFLGADFHWCTFIHHIETSSNVGYRKPVPVTVRCVERDVQGRERDVERPAFRFKRPDRYWPDFERFRNRLAERGILRETTLGRAYVAMASAEAMYQDGLAFLLEDPHAFVQVQPWPRYVVIRAGRLLRRLNDRLPAGLRPLR